MPQENAVVGDRGVVENEFDGGKASCERVLFAEKEQVMIMLNQIATPESNTQERKRLLKGVTAALEKYLEQPHLLDPHLEDMMSVVMGRAKELVMDREAAVLADAGCGSRDRPVEAFPFQVFTCPQLQDLFCVIYQLCRARGAKAVVRFMPHEAAELEPVIHALEAQDTEDHSTWETRYGLLLWLAMLSLVPFDIDTMDSGLAERHSGESVETEANALTAAADGGAAEEEGVPPTQAASGGRRADLVGTILSLGMKYLEDAGPTRDAAAACLSSLLTRPDMEASHLRCFLEWSSIVLERVTVEGRAGREGLSKLAFLVMGVMDTLASLFKQGHRGKLVDLIPVVFDAVVGLAELGPGQTLLRKMLVKLLQRIGTTYLPPRVVTWRYSRGQRSLLQSLAASGDKKDDNQSAPTPPEGMKEKRGDNALLPVEGEEGRDNGVAIVGVNGQQQEKLREGGELPPRAEQAPEGREEDEGVEVPEELEDIVDALLCGLRDRDTVVRWSAAKGIGRITERLPHELGDDVVCSVLDLFIEAEWDGSWHGGCLALAELARRGLLLPERLPRACPLVRRALLYDVRRGAGSVGAQVRDAACYVCWAFARAYSPQVLGPHLPGLCDSMLSTALFDREVNVRRAAAAAFQENVGRQGQYGDGGLAEGAEEGSEVGGVAHGIAIITAADYFSLGNRQQAYLEITTTVASFERYRRHLVDSLRLEKLHHWDPEIRNLAAAALGNAASLDPVYAAETVLPAALVNVLSPELLRRHGACLAASEITLALGKIAHPLPAETMEGLLGIVPALEKARLYRGRGGELMRQAACKVVECLALTRAEVPVKTQLRLLDSIDATLKHPLEHIQQSAVAALKAVLRNWFPAGADGPSERLQKRTIGKYVSGLRTDDNPAVARGFALALGVLPRKLAGASRAALEDLLETLKDAAVGKHGAPQGSSAPEGDSGAGGGVGSCKPRVGGSGPGGEPDAETRRNAVRALTELCEGVGVGRAGGKDEDEGSSAPREVEDRCSRDKESSEERSGERSGGDLPVDSRSGWSPVRLSVEDVEGVISTLLAASEDYLVDNRGDVGSWCRMEALVGLERIARLAARASSRALPFLVDHGGENNSGEATRASPVPFVVPALEDRLALMEMPPAPIPSPHPCDEVYLTPSMVERVLCAVLKQLSEKLDAVRERAGSVLQRIVESDDPRLPFVPEREALARAVRGEVDVSKEKAAVNWAIPSETFPIVVALLAVPEYHDAIVTGLVISVGGLTESVVKSSSNSLLRWVRACKSLGNKRSVAGLAMRLVDLLGEAKGDARVVIPLLKTVELLLSNECFDFLSAEDHPFATRLLAAVAAELKGCRDVKRICLGASLFVCLLDYEDPARARALRSSVLLLGHRFPSVRKTTAEALYLKLLANETIVDEAVYDEVLDLLTCTEWDGDIHAARAVRSELSEMLGVSMPAVGSSNAGTGDGATSGSRAEEKPRKADELESYKSLVRSTGY